MPELGELRLVHVDPPPPSARPCFCPPIHHDPPPHARPFTLYLFRRRGIAAGGPTEGSCEVFGLLWERACASRGLEAYPLPPPRLLCSTWLPS